jgi:uncharacterized protein (DUF1499 family)
MSSSLLKLNLVDGSVSFSFTPEAAHELKAAIAILMNSLKSVATPSSDAGRRSAQQPMEYCHTGDVFLEIFCNPNIWSSPFAAKVLITLRDEHIRLTTEAELTQVVEDLNLYLEEHCEAGSLRSPGYSA